MTITYRKPLLVPADAADAYTALGVALSACDPPCRESPDEWFDGDVGIAAAACESCPARRPCLSFATAAGESFGVWGGKSFDRTRPGSRCDSR